jgi:hypothetical protein
MENVITEIIVLCLTSGFLCGALITWFIIDYREIHAK